jgi:hypothetical protein
MRVLEVSGDHSERVPPLPIPNREVKPLNADGTAGATLWESRKSPGFDWSPPEMAGSFSIWHLPGSGEPL